MSKILVIDDEKSIRNSLKDVLEYEKYTVEEAEDGMQGLSMIQKNNYQLILCDIKMPKMDGIDVLEMALEKKPDSIFVMISGHGTIETAVEALKKGAYDFLEKPVDLNRLLVTVRNAFDKKGLEEETKKLKRKINSKKTTEIIGNSKAINEIKELIEKVAPSEARVLITGANGTGKELIARQIHELSNRNKGPFIEVNCAAIPSELIESELFGHEKGAFTSAHKQRLGKFEQAVGGTLFLDEIGDMSSSAQAKVLRALQEKKITRVGGEKEISVNVRILAATNKDLKTEIKEGNFREDLYHRLSVILIKSPSLSERLEDIELLVPFFVKQISDEQGFPEKRFTAQSILELQKYSWPGNIRECRNIVERLLILGSSEISDKDVSKYLK